MMEDPREPDDRAEAAALPALEGATVRPVRVVAAVVWRDGRVLMTQRPPGGDLGLLWEFPGGKIEPGETPECALEREVREELGVGARPLARLGVYTHRYPHGVEVEIEFIRCGLDCLEFAPSPAVNAARWVLPEDVRLDEVLAGDHAFLRSLGAS